MNILVTGGAGFIGSHLCERLLAMGEMVIALDNISGSPIGESKRKNISGCMGDKNFRLHDEDIRDAGKMDFIFYKEKPDIVVHLGARAGVRESLLHPEQYIKTNIDGTKNLLELAVKYKVKNFIFASSSSVYGTNSKVPFSESDPLENVVSPYAQTKKDGEILCKEYHDKHMLNVICLRFFTVYGPRGRIDMAPYKFVDSVSRGEPIEVYMDEKEFETGNMARDFTYVSDIVEGIVLCLDKKFGFATFNLGRGEPVRLNEFIATIEKHLGKKAVKKFVGRQKGDVPITFADTTKARKYLGYEPKVSLDEGLKLFVDWYNENTNA